MIAHVVLFSPKRSLTAADRAAFVGVLERALSGIPGIAAVRLGRRVISNRPYEQLGPAYEYVAILEFDSADALRRYLDHPAHDALGEAFYVSLEQGFAGDFELTSDARALLSP